MFKKFYLAYIIYIMSAMYSDVPPGGLQNIPPAIPTGMLYRVKMIQGISKQT